LFIAAVLLAVDLFIGVATLGRVSSATADDLRYVGGMNRLRHAYHEMVPGLEPYFISSRHDDVPGLFGVYGGIGDTHSRAGILHGLTTTPGMLSTMCVLLAAALAGVLVLLVIGSTIAAAAAALTTLLIGLVVSTTIMARYMGSFIASLRPAFPRPPERS
jgi:hypothetical protein